MSNTVNPQDIPYTSDLVPEILQPDAKIKFNCYKGISCYNACCKQADVSLTPYDIIRLKQATDKDSSQLLKEHTVPFTMDADGMPGIKLRTTNEGACLFMHEDTGCTVYADRPAACRYYPLGNLAIKNAAAAHENQHFVLIQEAHCKGHEEAREIPVQDYRNEQKVAIYEQHNIEYFQLILKKKSMGPGIGKPPEMSLQLYFMVCFDQDRFRRFVLSDAFQKNYILDNATTQNIRKDDVALMYFGFRLLRQVLYNEVSIQLVAGALDKRLEERKEILEMRRQAEQQNIHRDDPYMSCKQEVEDETATIKTDS